MNIDVHGIIKWVGSQITGSESGVAIGFSVIRLGSADGIGPSSGLTSAVGESIIGLESPDVSIATH